MLFLYNLFLPLIIGSLRIASFFDAKIRRGFAGRIKLQDEVREHYRNLNPKLTRFLIHVASYGELEQAKPVISAIRARYPEAHIHLTFFSPSGYENAFGKFDGADFITYSPIDRRKNVSQFLDAVNPAIVLFTRYDVWPNIADELKQRQIPTILFAATAAEGSGRLLPFVKKLHAIVYKGLTKILAIGIDDKARFEAMGVSPENIVVAGDTRFDQVIIRRQNTESKMADILPDNVRKSIEDRSSLVFVVGSSWPSDEEIIRPALSQILSRRDNILTIIAPHEPSENRVRALLAAFPKKSIRFSNLGFYSGEPIIIIDSIGKLFGLYRYADIAQIGGGFSSGVHNVLEAAVWSVPAIVGPNHKKSQEVQQLIDSIAAFQVSSRREFDFAFWKLAEDDHLRATAGKNAAEFISERQGATSKITDVLDTIIPKGVS